MPDQRMSALARANAVRFERARIRKALSRRHILLDEVLERPPECLDAVPVVTVIEWARGFGRIKAHRLVKSMGLPLHQRLGNLGDARRRELVRHAAGKYPRAFYGAAHREYL